MTVSTARTIIAATATAILAANTSKADAAEMLAARVDPRVELLSIVFRLAGHPEYNQSNSASAYANAVESHFGTFRDHPAVKKARELRRTHGISFDAVMSYAVHLSSGTDPDELTPFEPRPARLEKRWTIAAAREFLPLLQDFVRESRFAAFVSEHQEYYKRCAKQMEKKLAERDYVLWFDNYFGERPTAKFYVVLGLLNGGANYGVGMRFPDGREEISPVIGISDFDEQGLPRFGNEFVSLVIHEFCHSYTNHLVDQFADQLQPAGTRLFALVADKMKRQAYADWESMMYESFVRAVVIRALADLEGDAAAARQVTQDQQRGFLWIKELVSLLKEYEADRTQYTSFEQFVPRIVAFFNEAAPRYEKQNAAEVAKRPRVVAMLPANGDKRVDPALTTLTITFDRAMRDGQWSICGGGADFPKVTGPPKYDNDRKVLTVPIQLQPNHDYHFSINCPRAQAFVSDAGVALQPVPVSFRTRGEQE